MPSGPPRYNFFLLLGINPDERWDEIKFRTVLEQKRREWAKTSTGVGPKAIEAKRYLGFYSQIQQVMADPTERENEANEARKERANLTKERLEKFEKQLEVAQSKGYLEEEELKQFVKDFADVLTEAQIRGQLSVKVQAAVTPYAPKRDQLDPTTAKEIAQKLDALQMHTLYELLGKPPTHSRADLKTLANQLYSDMVRRPPSPETTLKMELGGLAMKVFDDDAMRAKYDATLRQARIDALLKELEEIVSRTTSKEVHESQITKFLEDAGKLGWGRVEALAELKAYARNHKWTLIAPMPNSAPQQRCGFCLQMNDMPRNFCCNCNRELNLNCPNCGQPVVADAIGCGSCGFRVGDRFWVDDSTEYCRQLIAKKNVAEARLHLSDLEAAWKPAKRDQRLEKIRECHTALDELIKDEQRAADEQRKKRRQIKDHLEDLIRERKFYEAQQFLNMQTGIMPERHSYQGRINSALDEAKKKLGLARSANASYDDRVASCEQALAVCVDYQEAKDLLKTFPPPAPQGLQAKVKDTTVTLSWTAPSNRALQYHIVRKKLSHPNSPKDAEVSKTISGVVYDDLVPDDAIGVPLYYAVYTEYQGAISSHAALLSDPVLLKQDVSSLSLDVDQSLVELQWQPPHNVYKVVVMRKEQHPPSSLADADAVRVGDFDNNQRRWVDRSVKNEQVYYYAFYCQFRDHEGRIETTSGVSIRAKPEAPPEPPGALELIDVTKGNINEIHINWQRPKKGRMVIIKSSNPLPSSPGAMMSESQLLAQHKDRLESRTTSLVDTWTQAGVIYYTPAIISEQLAYLGASQRHVCVENVRDLRCETLGSVMRLYWTWPEQCEQVIVYSSNMSWPLTDDHRPASSHVSSTIYEHTGYFDLPGTVNQHYYIVVAAVMKYCNEQVTSQGARLEVRLLERMEMTYEISQPTVLHGNWVLHISTQIAGSLPALLLVSRRDRLPFRKEDGETVLRIEPRMIGGREVVIEVPGRYPPGTLGRLFVEDDKMNEMVKIHQPTAQKLRLG